MSQDKPEPELPDLPEPDGAAAVKVATASLPNGMIGSVEEYIPAWSEGLVRSYARAAVLAERERCAKLCDAVYAEEQQ